MSDVSPNPARVVAVTGARTFLGTEILRYLADDPSIEKIVALDIREPDVISDKLVCHFLDLSAPTAGMDLSEILRKEAPDTIVHGAFLSAPVHDVAWAHELEDVGTMHVLDAVAKVPVQRFLLLSSTMVYGARPDNPNYLLETAKLSGMTASRFVNDKIKADQQVQRFARNHPEVHVCTLRIAPILGPSVVNLYTRVLSRPLAPRVAGFDPLMQVIHESDALRACIEALRQSARGIYNIVGRDVLPYSTLLALLGRVPVSMPRSVANFVGKAMWATKLSEVPPSLLDMLTHICVADGSKAQNELGFRAKYDIRQTLADFHGLPDDSQHYYRSIAG